MNVHVNISNVFNFSDVHAAKNRSGLLAKLTRTPSGFIYFARYPLRFIHFLNNCNTYAYQSLKPDVRNRMRSKERAYLRVETSFTPHS